MTAGARAAVLYASAMLVLVTASSSLLPDAPLVVRAGLSHFALAFALALFAWVVLLEPRDPGSFPSLVNSKG